MTPEQENWIRLKFQQIEERLRKLEALPLKDKEKIVKEVREVERLKDYILDPEYYRSKK